MDDQQDFSVLQEKYLAAIALSPPERERFLAELSPALGEQIRSLLDSTPAEDFLDADRTWPMLHELMQKPSAPVAGDRIPETIGEFAIKRFIGEGGMGRVFEAEQAFPQRRVALKLLKTGLTNRPMIWRFEREAKALARLDHPAIAHIYHAGSIDLGAGVQPFLVMELVAGKPLNQFVRERNHTLSLHERLRLMLAISDAVHHAHQRGVIHRDLKPANILVNDQGEPKMLDFGIARITEDVTATSSLHTEEGQLLGTLRYMSPEQTTGNVDAVDVTSDVYALGVITFEALTGRLPYRADLKADWDWIKAIREEEPVALRKVDRSLPRDVEWVVLKALSKDRARRYSSAAEFSAELRRLLSDEAVDARPPSATYQLRKFARRNRLLVGSAAAMTGSLLGGIVATSVALTRESHQRGIAASNEAIARTNEARANSAAASARTEAANKTAVANFYVNLLDAANPKLWGSKMDVTQMYQVASAELARQKVGTDPLVDAQVRSAVGFALVQFGELQEAEPLILQAEHASQTLPPEHPQRLSILKGLMELRCQQGKTDEAVSAGQAYLRVMRTKDRPVALAIALENCAAVLLRAGRYAEADVLYREAFPLLDAFPPEFAKDRAGILSSFAQLRLVQGRRDEAVSRLLDAEKVLRAANLKADLPQVLNALSVCYAEEKRWGVAERLVRESMKLARETFGPRHRILASGHRQLGYLLCVQRRFAEAEESARTAMAMHKEVSPGDLGSIAADALNLAMVLEAAEKTSYADAQYREAVELCEQAWPKGSELTANALKQYADFRYKMADQDAAERLVTKELGIRRNFMPPGSAELLGCYDRLHGLLLRQDRRSDVVANLRTLESNLPATNRSSAWSEDECRLAVFVRDSYAHLQLRDDATRVESRMPHEAASSAVKAELPMAE